MKYKALLTGKNNSVIDDFFLQMDDDFEVLTTSARYADMVRHLNYFQPDIFVYCIYNESGDVFAQLSNLKPQLKKMRIPFILIGPKEACDEFERFAVRVSDLTLLKPLTADAIGRILVNYMQEYKTKGRNREEIQPEEAQPIQPAEEEMVLPKTEYQERKHILVVDDSPIMLKTLKEHLRNDYDIATAVSGKVAMKFLERRKTDLILLDYEMPEESGPAVLEKLRASEETKDIPVIFLTGVTDSGKIREALVLKPQGYLLKPIDHDKLLEAITNVIG